MFVQSFDLICKFCLNKQLVFTIFTLHVSLPRLERFRENTGTYCIDRKLSFPFVIVRKFSFPFF